MDVLDRIKEAFPSCPMCLSEDLENQLLHGKKLKVLVGCESCHALFQLTKEDNKLYCALIEKEDNPRKLEYEIESLKENHPVDAWNQLRRPINFCRDCGGQMITSDIDVRIGGATGGDMLLFGTQLQFLDKLPVEMSYCPKCRHLEFHVTEKWLNRTDHVTEK